jgi:hypothetical protein
MASGYTMMSRLYAITLREIARGLRIPWPVWRGNLAAVAELDRILRERQAARQGANLKA